MKSSCVKVVFAFIIMTMFCQFASAQKEIYNDATVLFNKYEYAEAIQLYKKVIAKKGKHANKATVKIADAYRLTGNNVKAQYWYNRSVALAESPSIHRFYYAQSLLNNGKYDEAKKWFNAFALLEPGDARGKRFSESIDQQKQLKADSANYTISSMVFNTQGSAFGPSFFKNGIVFTAEPERGQTNNWTGSNYLDLYYTEPSGTNDWTTPNRIKGDLKSKFHEGPASFTNDNQLVYFTRSSTKKGNNNVTNLEVLEANANTFEITNEMPFNNKSYTVAHPYISADGKTIYFSSDMPGGFGGTDLYKSTMQNGAWSEPENLGENINTAGEDMFAFIHPDGTLYFATNGHGGFGGLDVYRSYFDGNEMTEAENLGYPINTKHDDFTFILSDDYRYGFFASNRKGPKSNDDIYLVRLNEEAQAKFKPNKPVASVVEEEVVKELPELEEEVVVTEEAEIVEEITTTEPTIIDEAHIITYPTIIKEIDSSVTISTLQPSLVTPNQEPTVLFNKKPEIVTFVEPKADSVSITKVPNPNAVTIDNNIKPIYPEPIEMEFPEVESETVVIEESEPKTIVTENPIITKSVTIDTLPNVSNAMPASKIVDGLVSNAIGTGIPYATIKVTDKGSNETFETKSDYKGQFNIELKSVNHYEIEVSANEYKTSFFSMVMSSNSPIVGKALNIALRSENATNNDVNTPIALQGNELIKSENDEPAWPNQSTNENVENKTVITETITEPTNIVKTPYVAPKVEVPIEPGLDQVLNIDHIYYDYGSARLRTTSMQTLKKLYVLMQGYPNSQLIFNSHADSRGSANDNMYLSSIRNRACSDYLVSMGVNPSRIIEENNGENQLVENCPPGANCNEYQHQLNRRTEIRLVDGSRIIAFSGTNQERTEETQTALPTQSVTYNSTIVTPNITSTVSNDPINFSRYSANQGLMFSVQLGAFVKPITKQNKYIKSAPENIQFDDFTLNGMHRYVSGSFSTEQEAIYHRKELRNYYSDAYVVAYNNGQRIQIYEARKILQGRR